MIKAAEPGQHDRDVFARGLGQQVTRALEDWREATYYEHSPAQDPLGPEIGEHRVLRGGSWQMSAQACRSASRLYGRADNENNDVGFRVVLVDPETK